MNSRQRRKLQRRWKCRKCGHSECHCPSSGCNYYEKVHYEVGVEDSGLPLVQSYTQYCSCEEFVPIYLKHRVPRKTPA